MSPRQERLSYLAGWLEGFSSTVWALVSTGDGAKLVAPETANQYDEMVHELRETLEITFKSGEDE